MLLDHGFGIGTRIKAMTYCDDLDILSLGFYDGSIHSFHFDIQHDKDTEPADDDDDEDYGQGVHA